MMLLGKIQTVISFLVLVQRQQAAAQTPPTTTLSPATQPPTTLSPAQQYSKSLQQQAQLLKEAQAHHAQLMRQALERSAAAAARVKASLPPDPAVVHAASMAEAYKAACGTARHIDISGDSWPQNAKGCDHCEARGLGGCLLEAAGAVHDTCPVDNSECINIGRCVCSAGWCRSEDRKSCVQQVCHEGARPPPFQPSQTVSMFESLGRAKQFPQVEELKHNPSEFISTSCTSAGVLLVIGCCIALWLFMYLDCDEWSCKWKCCGLHSSSCTLWPCIEDPATQLDDGEEMLGTPRSPRTISRRDHSDSRFEQELRKPSHWPVLVLAAIVGIVSFVGFFYRQHQWNILQEQVLAKEIMHAHDNAQLVAEKAAVLADTCTNLQTNLAMLTKCGTSNPLLAWIGGMANSTVTDYVRDINEMSDTLQPIPGELLSFKMSLDAQETWSVWVPMCPLLLVSVICLLLCLDILYCEFATPNEQVLKHADCGIMIAAGLFSVIILVVTIISAAALATGIGISELCKDVDNNALRYVSAFGNNSQMDGIARHYVLGDVENPIEDMLQSARMYINQVEALYQDFKIHIDTQALSCHELNQIDITGIQGTALCVLDQLRPLVSAANIYPYYDVLVHRGVCTHVIESLATTIGLQVTVGLVLFPICAVCAHRFLKTRLFWFKAEHGRLGSLSGSSDGE